jgi:hypothetical protein
VYGSSVVREAALARDKEATEPKIEAAALDWDDWKKSRREG